MNQTLKIDQKKNTPFLHISSFEGKKKKRIKMRGHINDYFHKKSSPPRLF